MRLAAMDDGGKGETATGSQAKKPPSMKGTIFSRLGNVNQVDEAGKEKQVSSLKLQSETKQKYSPRRQVSKWTILNGAHLVILE